MGATPTVSTKIFELFRVRIRTVSLLNIRYKINNQISAVELRIIDEKGENLGVFPREAAMKLAEEKGSDLIEIAPNAKPPVARIMSFDKFRYQEEKKAKKQRQAQKAKELKHVRISPRAATNDLQIKAKQAVTFLQESHKVEINLFLRGREKANKAWGLKKLDEFLQMIKTPYQITMPPRQGGRGYVVQIAKK